MDRSGALSRALGPLLAWYRAEKRDLPWRRDRTPYTVLVSELMLQQTRVEAVRERYVQFLERFPTAEALAAASEEEVLKSWEGLGYYSRARNLHAAAKEIARCGFPETEEGVRALPGVGNYTAGAVCSIALGLPVPAVDGNVLRILTRFFADDREIGHPAVKREFSTLLRGVYPPQTGECTEALMELGAIVCVPNGPPKCIACPWEGVCKAHLMGRETEFPKREKKRERRTEELFVYVFSHDGKYAIEKRQAGLLKGMYGFPTAPAGEPPERFLASKRAVHIFTHVEWHMTGFLVETDKGPYLWATAEEIRTKYALPSAFKAFREWIKE